MPTFSKKDHALVVMPLGGDVEAGPRIQNTQSIVVSNARNAGAKAPLLCMQNKREVYDPCAAAAAGTVEDYRQG